jgi:hypothetical protein
VCREIGDLLVAPRLWRAMKSPGVSRHVQFRYIVSAMSASSLEPDDVRAAAELHRELGPEYRDAVVESFLDRVGKEIDARVDRRLAAQPEPQPRTPVLAIASVVLGIPLTAIIMSLSHSGQLAELALVWVAIALINVAYALGHRLPPPQR